MKQHLLATVILFSFLSSAQPIYRVLKHQGIYPPSVGSEFLVAAPGDGVLVFGSSKSKIPFVGRLDGNGNFLWGKEIMPAPPSNWLAHEFTDAAIMSDSTILATGYMVDTPGVLVPFFVRLRFNGDIIWTKKLVSNVAYMIPQDVSPISDSGAVLCGKYAWENGALGFMCRMEKDGNLRWTTIFDNFEPTGVFQTASQEYILSGMAAETKFRPALISLDSAGAHNWGLMYIESGSNAGICKDLLQVGADYILSFSSDNKLGLLLTDSTGALIWWQKFASEAEHVYPGHFDTFTQDCKLRRAANGSFLVVNKGQQDIATGILFDIGLQPSALLNSSFEKCDMLFTENGRMHITLNPSSIMVRAAQPREDDRIGHIIIHPDSVPSYSGCVYKSQPSSISSTFTTSAFTSTAQSVNLACVPLQPTISIVQLTTEVGCLQMPTALGENLVMQVNVAPNPVQSIVQFIMGYETANSVVILYNLPGQVVATTSVRENGVGILDMSSLPSGIYFYSVQTDHVHIQAGKIIKN